MSTTYHVVVTREDDSWLADVPQLPGVHTWARTLPKLEEYAREAIAQAEDLPVGAEAGLALAWDFRSGDPEVDTQAATLRDRRAELARAERDLAQQTAELARSLRSRLSVRDTAAVLGVSPQRISQVAPERSSGRTARRRGSARGARGARSKVS